MTTQGTEFVASLEQLAGRIDDAGTKAATLARLARAGYAVPPGVVVTARAFALFLEDHLESRDDPKAVYEAPLPDVVEGALDEALRVMGDVPLAVRSSAVAEDLPGASFAGQYETVLGVRGAEALRGAVRRCWASAFGDRVRAYRQAQGLDDAPRMAVLVQRLVDAEAAGVAFSANPVSGDRDEVLVSAVRGLGERLVSGEATPDEWQVRGTEASCRIEAEGAITAAHARAVAALARRVEAELGGPQDIEWALEDGRLFLLQARPITTLPERPVEPIPVPAEPPPGIWQRETSHAPQPWSPMQRSFFYKTREVATRHMCDDFGLLFEYIQFAEIGGWEYVRPVPLGGKDRKPPPDWLMRVLIRLVPSLRRRIAQSVEAVRSNRARKLVERWYAEWLPEFAAVNQDLRSVDPARLSDDELGGHLERLLDHVSLGVDIKGRLHGAEMAAIADIAFACRDLLGWDEGRAFAMLSGLSRYSTEPARRLADLAELARGRPAVRAVLDDPPPDPLSALEQVDREFSEALGTYLQTHGRRTLRYDLADPTLAETPLLVLSLTRDQLARPYRVEEIDEALETERDGLLATARAELAGRSEGDRARFEGALATALRAYPVREDSEAIAISVPLALMRFGFLELGRRLCAEQRMAEPGDIFFLEYPDAAAALRGDGDQRDLVRRRKGERAWVLGHPGPESYGGVPGIPPSFAALPREARFAHEALVWMLDRIAPPLDVDAERDPQHGLHGIAASPGRYTGTVRVILDETQFDKLRAGDVLVCPITSPVWSVLFPSVGALVTDTGGILAHASIIAREYRVPAVVATGRATSTLRDGQVVTVDGSAGTVEAHAG